MTSNDLLFSNERRDPGTGDYQLGARTYQPDQATFLTPDRDRNSTPASPGIGRSLPLWVGSSAGAGSSC